MHIFIYQKTDLQGAKKRVGGKGTCTLRAGETPHSEKSRAFASESCIFLQILFSRAVRKGARGKVNLTPLSLARRHEVFKSFALASLFFLALL